MDHKALHPRMSVRKSGSIISGEQNLTEEERKIRDKLEEEVERGLEDEIKDGIYRLALRLRRLYETRKERSLKNGEMKSLISEVNICIKMDGGTKVEIREARIRSGKPRIMLGARCSDRRSGTRLDWAESLRSRAVKKREPFRFG